MLSLSAYGAVACHQAGHIFSLLYQHVGVDRWKPGITHVVLPSLVRSVKSLAGMAAGRWILHADFVEASASAEALVDPVSINQVARHCLSVIAH